MVLQKSGAFRGSLELVDAAFTRGRVVPPGPALRAVFPGVVSGKQGSAVQASVSVVAAPAAHMITAVTSPASFLTSRYPASFLRSSNFSRTVP